MDVMQGKILFVVNLVDSLGNYIGDEIKETLIEGGYSGVALKVCHGNTWNPGHSKADRNRFRDQIRGIVSFYGWHWNLGLDPEGEAIIMCQAIDELGLEAYMQDYEAPMKNYQAAQITIMEEFRIRKPDFPVGLCSYRYPSGHPGILWKQILPFFDFHAPQVYWVEAHNPAYQLQKSYEQLMALKEMPFIPVGAAYQHDSWKPTVEDLQEFNDKAKDMGLQGIQWFTYRGAKPLGLLPALADLDWPVIPPDPGEPGQCQDLLAKQAAEYEAQIADLKLQHSWDIKQLKEQHQVELLNTKVQANNDALQNLIKSHLL